MTDDVAAHPDARVRDDTGDVSVVRHEQRLNATTERYATERVRVSKVIVTEERTITVTVRREELHVTREPVQPDTPLVTAGRTDTPDLVITLHTEVPLVTMQVVPAERVRISRTSVADVETVAETLAQERVEIDAPTTTR